MKVLVIHASRMGSTREIAERIATRLREEGIDATAQAVEATDDLAGYDGFVIGSGVYAGHWLKEAKAFVERHRATLSDRLVWLFSSGPVGPAATDHRPIEPKDVAGLVKAIHPFDHVIFGGTLDRQAVDAAGLGTVERFVAKRFVPEGDFRDWDAITAWADGIANVLARETALAR
jgi:menaquinone-dependent protoporphyrinogen oxidase